MEIFATETMGPSCEEMVEWVKEIGAQLELISGESRATEDWNVNFREEIQRKLWELIPRVMKK